MKIKPLNWQHNAAESIDGYYLITSNNDRTFYLKRQHSSFKRDEYIFIDSFSSLNAAKDYAQKLHEFQLSLMDKYYDHGN